MRVSYAWLKQLSGVDVAPGEIAERLTSAGLEVEALEPRGQGLDAVVVAEVRSVRPHPQRDKLRLVQVFDGQGELDVVCGADNVPDPGGRVALAKVGARLPNGLEIAERELGGARSRGMLCSEVELDIGSGDAGILVLGEDTPAPAGTPLQQALDLEDTVLTLGLTPNRADCLGHIGVAREVCALFDAPLPGQQALAGRLAKPSRRLVEKGPATQALTRWLAAPSPEQVRVDVGELGPVSVSVGDEVRCPRYGAALVLDVKIAPSPFAVRYRLHVLGLRAINNAVDATNLVLMGFGHPIHGFDLETLAGPRIDVRPARPGERLHTLDGVERTLTEDDLLICDGAGPVALAGVMGGASSEISDRTRHVLIECAYFDPRSVRRTSRRQGLSTDSSHRFERGVDPNAVPQVLAHASALIAQLCGGAVLPEALDVIAAPQRPRRLSLRRARLASVLGTEVPDGETGAILARLGFDVTARGEGWSVTVPTFRHDVTREIDLVEEVARVRGYDAIPTELPAVRPSAAPDEAQQLTGFVRSLRTQAVAAGLDECVNYAFVAARDLELAKVATEAVALRNPLSEERAVMRTSHLPGLAANLRRAQHHQVRSFAAFELGRVFAPAGEGDLPEERHELAVLMAGPHGAWLGEGPDVDFYDGKGVLEAITRACTGRPVATWLDPELAMRAPFLHPRRSASVTLDGRWVGDLGELHPDVTEALELERRPVFARLDVERLWAAKQAFGPVVLQAPPRFPAVTRDLAVVVEETLPAGDVAQVLGDAGGSLVEDVQLFDLYRGDPVPSGCKSLAFRVTYRDREATLTDAKVDQAHGRVVQAAEQRFGAQVR